jgi:hypothetical protein
MTTIKAHLSSAELEGRYKTAVDPIGKSHFHALWLLSCGYAVDEVGELLSFSPRWVRALLKRYNDCGAEALGDQRSRNGTKPTILTPDALAALRERIKTPPDDGGLWAAPMYSIVRLWPEDFSKVPRNSFKMGNMFPPLKTLISAAETALRFARQQTSPRRIAADFLITTSRKRGAL